MKDLVTNGNGNSRFLRSAIPAGTTWEEALALFRAGQFPIDLNGLNQAGISQAGSAYSKANVLPDALCNSLGITSSTAEPKDAWNALLQKTNTVQANLTSFINNDFPQPSKQGVARPNLLENWYFYGGGSQNGNGRFPINQREATSQTAAGYFCDRWKKNNGNGSVSLTNNGMVIAGTGSASTTMYQPIEYSNRLFGKQVTISMLNSAGSLSYVTCTLPSALPSSDTLYGTASTIGNVTLSIRGNSSFFYVQMTATATSSTAIQAVKLELGPNQTLARQVGSTWVLTEIPHYATELLKCQRHMIIFHSSVDYYSGSNNYSLQDIIGVATYDNSRHDVFGFIPLPITMRTNPTVDGALELLLGGQTNNYTYGGSLEQSNLVDSSLCVRYGNVSGWSSYNGEVGWIVPRVTSSQNLGLILNANM